MTVSILQISDLHRDGANPIRNGPLLSSIETDHDRYLGENTSNRSPDLIFVTGDIVQGVSPTSPNADRELKAQYEEALEFLRAVTDRFVGGDRGRVVIIPGNHDVSAWHVAASVRAVSIPPDGRRGLVDALFTPNSRLRWSWSELALFEIHDEGAYARRLEAFLVFYRDFYDGARTYSLNDAEQFDLFDYPELNLVVAGFSSCFNNDLMNRQGAIDPRCIAKVGTILREPRYADRIRIAVWHHNTEGSPLQSDYMNAEILQNLIECGFSLGFHGHQHRPQFLDTRFRYGDERRMTVISAGTLCGTASYRFARAYNIVDLDVEMRTGLLHLREMQNDLLELPIWGPRAMSPLHGNAMEFEYEAPPKSLMRPDGPTSLLLRAQDLFEGGHFREAADLLEPLASRGDLERRLYVECLHLLHDGEALIDFLDPPDGTNETIYLMDALWSQGEGGRERLRAVLSQPAIQGSSDPSVIELKKKYEARLGHE